MASRKVLLITAAAAMAIVMVAPLPATAFPNNHLVGDLDCWQPGVNYDAWVESMDNIKAGDTLEFIYDPTMHNVAVMVNEDGYNNCNAANNLGTWNFGDDQVQLPEAGRYFFICGMGDYCTNGMKFAITAV